MVNTILYITILVNIITTILINKSKSNDIYLLIFAYIGQMILVYGYIYDSDYMIYADEAFARRGPNNIHCT